MRSWPRRAGHGSEAKGRGSSGPKWNRLKKGDEGQGLPISQRKGGEGGSQNGPLGSERKKRGEKRGERWAGGPSLEERKEKKRKRKKGKRTREKEKGFPFPEKEITT